MNKPINIINIIRSTQVEKKIIISWIVSLIITLLFTGFLFYSKLKLLQASSDVEQYSELRSATQNLLSSIQKHEIISLRLTLTRNLNDSANYYAQLNSLKNDLIRIEDLVKNNNKLKELFYPIRRSIQDELFKLDHVNYLKRSNKNIDKIIKITEENISQKLDDFFKSLNKEEENLAKEQVQSFNSKVNKAINNFVILAVICIINLSALFAVIIFDLKKRKMLIQELSKSKNELDTIINTVPAMIFVKNVDKKHTLLNKSYLEFFNIDNKINREEVLSYADKKLLTLDINWLIDEEEDAIVENKIPLINIEREISLENGKSICLNINRAPMFDDKNNVVGIVGVMDDITKRIEFENALIDAKNKLEELNKQKDKMFSIIAHDLRSPFNGILGYIEILSEELSDLSEEEKKLYISIIQSSLKDLLSLIDNLLRWARLNLNREDYNPREITMSEIINSVIVSHKIVAANKKINIHSNIDKNMVAFADPDMLETIIRNLVSNAIKFTNPGGNIKINAYYDNQSIIIEIVDSGVGMMPEIANNLFKIDANVTSRGTNNEKGTGLGLIICKNFIEKHGGKISLKSEIGKGTIVSFNLPLNLEKQ